MAPALPAAGPGRLRKVRTAGPARAAILMVARAMILRIASGRPCLVLALLCLLGAAVPGRAEEAPAFPVTVTDLAGRGVTIPAPPARIVLAEGVQFLSLALVDPDIAARLALIGADLQKYDPGTFAALAEAYPGLAAVPAIRDDGAGLPVELVLAARPDLVIFGLWQKPAVEPLVAQLEGLGVPVIFIDFFVSPIGNTPASTRLLGQALGRREAGEAFAAFHEARIAAVREAVAGAAEPPPSVLVNAYPGLWACCWSAGRTGFGEFIDIAGGRNIGADRFPNELGGTLAVEFVLAADPDVYVATGVASDDAASAFRIGGGLSPEAAAESLAAVTATPPLSDLRTVREGRAHGLWNYFNGTPLNILGIEAMAGWFHPSIAAALDPATSRRTIEERFLGRPLPGTFWTTAAPPAGTR